MINFKQILNKEAKTDSFAEIGENGKLSNQRLYDELLDIPETSEEIAKVREAALAAGVSQVDVDRLYPL